MATTRAPRPRTTVWPAALAVSALALVLAGAGAASAREHLPVPYTMAAGILAEARTPGASPPGANDYSCRPSAAHPHPVILLHGFAANMTESWQTLSPLLHNAGYCVFAITYGTYAPVDPSGRLGGLDYIQHSATRLAAYVTKVRRATGAQKVDLVGWSEGGWLSRYYIQLRGGARYVGTAVGLAPANGPTNISQLLFTMATLPGGAPLLHLLTAGVSSVIPIVGQAGDPALFATLNAHGGTSDSVRYTNIASEYDELVPPSSAFIPTGRHVTNVVLQDGCPVDFTDHVSIATTRRATGFVLNALDPAHATPPPCVPTLPVVG